MSYSIVKQGDHYNNPLQKEFLLDYDSDYSNLPGLDECAPGSKAVSLESGKRWILTHEDTWAIKIDHGGGGGGVTVEPLSVTANGEYTAPSGKAYSPVSVNVGGGGWVRPSDWPELDALAAQIPAETDCVYLTYDLRVTTFEKWIGIQCKTADSSAWEIARGHIADGAFVADDTNTVGSGSTHTETLDPANGNVQLFRVTATGHIMEAHYMNSANGLADNLQPCVERSGILPWETKLTSDTSSPCSSKMTVWLERDSVVPGKLAAITGTALVGRWRDAKNLRSLDLSGWDTSGWTLTSLQGIWQGCRNLETIDASGWDTSGWKITTMQDMFYGCACLKTLNLRGWDTSHWAVTSIASIFCGCASLEEFDGFGWDTSNWAMTTVSNAFQDCLHLRIIDLHEWAAFSPASATNLLQHVNLIDTFRTPGDAPSSLNLSSYSLNAMLENYSGGCSANANQDYKNAIMLTVDSLLNIINALPTVSTKRTLYLGVNKNKLTAAQIAVATGKGWTVA